MSTVGFSDQKVEEMNGSGPSMTAQIDRDGPLLAALRRGDPTASEDLVAAYGDRASRLANPITGNAQDAEEVTRVPLAPKARHQSFLTSRRETSASVRPALNGTSGLHLADNLLSREHQGEELG